MLLYIHRSIVCELGQVRLASEGPAESKLHFGARSIEQKSVWASSRPREFLQCRMNFTDNNTSKQAVTTQAGRCFAASLSSTQQASLAHNALNAHISLPTHTQKHTKTYTQTSEPCRSNLLLKHDAKHAHQHTPCEAQGPLPLATAAIAVRRRPARLQLRRQLLPHWLRLHNAGDTPTAAVAEAGQQEDVHQHQQCLRVCMGELLALTINP